MPRTLVERAKQRKLAADADARRLGDDNFAFDQAWCVPDIDDHPRLDEALVMARANGIDLAVSNPSFELWLILHFRDNPGAQNRDRMVRMLKRYLPDYDKHVEFEGLAFGYSAAVQRARSLDEMAAREGEPGRNPTTGVWRLTESIRGDHGDRCEHY